MSIAKEPPPPMSSRVTSSPPALGIPALVLAGGMSQRMGECKYLLPFGEECVLGHILEVVRSVPEISWLGVVTGHFKQEFASLLAKYDAHQIENPNYHTGEMLSSVQAGVRGLSTSERGFLLLLGDQPLIQKELLCEIIRVAITTGAPLVQPEYGSKRGHPLFFGAECIPEILALPSNSTLKHVVSRHESRRITVPITDATILQDLDTPIEYQQLLTTFIGRNLHASR